MGNNSKKLDPSVENALDVLLAEWSESRRLAPERVLEIRDMARGRTTSAANQLSYEWWRKIFSHASVEIIPLRFVLGVRS